MKPASMMRTVKNFIHLLTALLACIYYRFPGRKMLVIGITGTDGKSTTTHLIYQILKSETPLTSMVSTIEAVINGKSYDTGFHVTTPSSWELQKFMRQAYLEGGKYFILEVTSHGLDQFRVWGSSIDIALVTNITHEHIDYHGSFNNYRAAKAKIYGGVKISILNKDDRNYKILKTKAQGIITAYAIDNEADYTLRDFHLKPKILGKFNLYNCLAAATVASVIGIKKDVINKAVAGFANIRGRMEEIKNSAGYRVFIDFAHKPNALEQALLTVRELTKGKVIVVFGTAGGRDKIKRPMMGQIAAQIADLIILTAEDPRTEDVRDIISQIAGGCVKGAALEVNKYRQDLSKIPQNKKIFFRIPDRQEAINFALRKLAKKGDSIIICGKGHEKSMCYGKTEYPWDEFKAVDKALYDSGYKTA